MPDSNRKLVVLNLKWYDIRIHRGILEYARGRHWDVLASPHEPSALDVPGADGQIVMIGPNDQRRTRLIENLDVPVVDLGLYSSLELPRVLPDNTAAGRLAAEAFLSKGFKELAVFSTQSHWYADERRKGFCSAVENAGLTCKTFHVPQDHLHKGIYSPNGLDRPLIHDWLTQAEKPLAIYTIEDESAAMLMRICLQIGLAVPEQVSLIGTNNDPVICPFTEVPLSSIDLNWNGIGYEAAAKLDRLMQGKILREQTTLVAPKGLIGRKSSDTIAVADLRVSMALSYIQENCHRHVTVAEITKVLDVPLRTLQWAFKKSMDCSIQDEISKRRIERIQEMLLTTDRNVGLISEDLGFSSAQYMNHFFTKANGVTPNEFRQQNQTDDL